MIEKYFIKWAFPAREDLNEIVEYIAQTNITYAVKILDKIELAVKNLDMSPKRGRIVPELERYGYILYREIIVDYWRIMYKTRSVYAFLSCRTNRAGGRLGLRKTAVGLTPFVRFLFA